MSLGDTARLIVQLDLAGNLSAGLTKVTKQLGELDKQVNGRISTGLKTIGAGLTVALIRGATIAVGAIGGITGAIVAMAKEGEDATKSQILFNQAVANSGKISPAYVTSLQAQQTALMLLAGVNDQIIEGEQTKLIQFGLTGEQVQALTPLILDYAIATGTDLTTATEQVGKATQGFTSQLMLNGVMIDKAKAKTDPYAATIDALNKQYKGTADALSGDLIVKLNVFHEALANIRAEAGIKLLPALTRLADIAGTKLVPAFAKFIDRVLPALEKGINDFANILESGGVERGINAITDAIGPMIKVLQLAVGPVQALVSAFLKLPQKVQAGLISGFLINKLSGGLVAQGGKDVLGGVGSLIGPSIGAAVTTALGKIGFTRGSSFLNPLFVSDVQNRTPDGRFASGFKPTPLGQALKFVGGALLITGVVALATDISGINDPSHRTPDGKIFRGTNDVDTQIGNLQRSIAELSKRAGTDPFAARQLLAAQNELVRLTRLQNQGITDLFGAINGLGGSLYMGGGRPERDDAIVPKGGKKPKPTAQNSPSGDRIDINITNPIRDTIDKSIRRKSYGPTPAQAGAMG